MASQDKGQQSQQAQGQVQPPTKESLAPILQQLNLTSLRTRTQDLHNALGRILHAFHTNPSLKWSDILGQFAMVNVELLNLIDDIKPILKMFVVYPKNVNADNAPILPIMLSSKLLPEMEAEEATQKEKILLNISGHNMTAQSGNLQESVRAACDIAEKIITEARKVYGLGTRHGPVALAPMDKANIARIAEQEKVLRAAINFGEGFRSTGDQSKLSQSEFPALSGFVKTSTAPVLPPTGLVRTAATTQQSSIRQVTARFQTTSQPVGIAGVAAASPSPAPYVNSPRSSGTTLNVPSPQQHQAAQLSYTQKIRNQQLQAQQQQQQLQQLQQQLRRPATPPIPQQLQPHQTLQQHAQVQQQLQAQQYRHSLQHLQAQHQQQQNLQQQNLQQQNLQQHNLQQQNIQQQNLQQQNIQQQNLQQLQTAIGDRPQLGQLGNSMNSLYGGGTNSLLTSNVFQHGDLSSNQLATNQPQRNVSSQMLTDSLYIGDGTQIAQGPSNLSLPMQHQLVSQSNFMNMFNNQTQSNSGQNRQQPPPS